MSFTEATAVEIGKALEQSHAAFLEYRKLSFKQRAEFMRAVAHAIEIAGDELVQIAATETNLPLSRLRSEKARAVFQWTSYAEACENGDWLNCRIDTANADRLPPKPDLRKTMVPLGPVVVFGASNVPFAYSTVGGDTASAFAAGCTVVVKAHPAHPLTSQRMADVIRDAISHTKMPAHIFQHVYGASFETGKSLVEHPLTKAIGFTGSISGGTALFKCANERKVPIPVFAEMGSTNPVFLFPGRQLISTTEIIKMLSSSITLGSGQFCTKPGLIIALDTEHTQNFIAAFAEEVGRTSPSKMLHTGIASAYNEKSRAALSQGGVQVHFSTNEAEEGNAAIASVSAKDFLQNPLLREEVFGPYCLIVRCNTASDMKAVADALEGQLTTTILATEDDMKEYGDIVASLKDLCGRLIFNGVPTGVEVVFSMHHGGPFPASTDSRFTAVGADAIRRFSRPVCYQNWPNSLLPDELKNENPLGFWRTVNNQLTKDQID